VTLVDDVVKTTPFDPSGIEGLSGPPPPPPQAMRLSAKIIRAIRENKLVIISTICAHRALLNLEAVLCKPVNTSFVRLRMRKFDRLVISQTY